MPRYLLLLCLTMLIWYGSGLLENRLYTWRTEAQATLNTPIVGQLENTPMPADAIDLQDVSRKLAELGQTQLLESIGLYMRYQLLARVLGLTPDSLATAGETVAWAAANPDRTGELQRTVLANALGIALAAPDVAPPKAGRDGRNYNLQFAPLGDGVWQEMTPQGEPSPVSARQLYVVLTVRNQLATTAINAFDFYPVIVDSNGQPVALPLPERSYFWCSHDNVMAGANAALAAGSSMAVLCELRGGGIEPLSSERVTTLLNRVRINQWHLVPWTKQLELALPGEHAYGGLQLHDHLVSAEYGHGPSIKTEADFIAAMQPSDGLPHHASRATTCEERNDCLKTRLAPFEGIISLARILLTGAIPGILIAGCVQFMTRRCTQRSKAVSTLAILNLTAFPIAYSMGGDGWGPLAVLLMTAYLSGGFWGGLLLALLFLPPDPAEQ